MIGKAQLSKSGDNLVIATPYNPRLVEEIRGIPGRRFDGIKKMWWVHVSFEPQIREIVRKFFQIEGESSYVEQVTLRVHVTCQFSGNGRYNGSVSIDGQDIFNPTSGYLDMRPNPVFEIVDHAGGFVEKKSSSDPYRIDYTLKLKVLKDAGWRVSGSATYEILSGDNPVDRFIEDLLQKENL
jgi:hypothetical protein